jgi:hypothetical protein
VMLSSSDELALGGFSELTEELGVHSNRGVRIYRGVHRGVHTVFLLPVQTQTR